MTFFFIFVAVMAVWMLWPASRNDGAASRAHLQDTEVRRVFRASDLDEFRPITTQAIAVKAYRMLIVTGKQIGRASCRERVSSPV